jgi:hypothetical protein
MVNFKSALFDKDRNDLVFVFANCLGKSFIFIHCKKTIIILQITKLFLIHVYKYYKAPESIILYYSP